MDQKLQYSGKAKNQGTIKNQKKRYHIDSANNFIMYERFKLLVSEPNNYFLVHLVLILGMAYFYVITFVVTLISYELNYIVIVLHVIATVLLVGLGFKNPGIVLKITEDYDNPSKIQLPFDKDSKPAVNQLAKSYVFPIKSHMIGLKFCPQCLIYKPTRTVHCWICNACIANMDHHCPFIGNCVGKGNYKFFFAFVCSLTIKLILIMTQLILMMVRLFERDSMNLFQKPELYFTLVLLLFCFPVIIFVGSLMVFHIYLIINSLTTNELCKNTWSTVSGNPFKKNFCIKNIVRFIRGPTDQGVPLSSEHLHKKVVPREKQKSQQYFSEGQSEGYAKQQSQAMSKTTSHLRSQSVQKVLVPRDPEPDNTGQFMYGGIQNPHI